MIAIAFILRGFQWQLTVPGSGVDIAISLGVRKASEHKSPINE